MKTQSRFRLFLGPVALVTAAALPFLTGCAGLTGATPVGTVQALHMSGSIHGGQQPVSGARVYLYTVSGALRFNATSQLTGAGVLTDENGNGYVTSDANGSFNITGDYTCPSYNTALSTYILATGGNPGLAAGTNNSAIALIAALGPCSGLSATTLVGVNEVSTVAAVTAMQQFMADATHVGSSQISSQPGYSAVQNIPNAMLTVKNLVDLSSGQALSSPVNASGTSPAATVNTLGNILASCINSTSPTSTTCAALFAAATPAGATAPTDTVQAMLLIARNPGTNVATLWGLSNSMPAFASALSTPPNDFTLGITYTGFNSPGSMTVDNAGDIFIANCPSCNSATGSDSIMGISATGALINPATFTSNIHKPVAVQIDRYNVLWVAEGASGALGNQLTRLTYDTGIVQSGFPVALNGTPGGMALVENENTNGGYFYPAAAWVSDSTNGRINLYQADGTLLGGLNTTGIPTPTAIAADGIENLYVIGSGSTNILQYGPIYDRTQLYGTYIPVTTNNLTTLTAGSSAGFSSPVSLAADGGDHLWTVNTGTRGVSEVFAYNNTATSGATGYTGNVNTAAQVTIDGAGTAWVANCRKNCAGSGSTAVDNIVHLSAAGASLMPSDGIQNPALATPTATAIDMSGNLWISNTTGASVTELVGVAAPVVTELETASSRHALPATNYLLNGSFENGAAGGAIPNWTFSTTGIAGVDTGSPYSGQQKLTYYSGAAYTLTGSQTISSLTSGNYLVTCYIASGPGSTTRTTSLIATSGGTTLSNAPTDLTYTFQPYSVLVPVANGSLTVTLSNIETYSGGGYVGWDSCSVTKQ